MSEEESRHIYSVLRGPVMLTGAQETGRDSSHTPIPSVASSLAKTKRSTYFVGSNPNCALPLVSTQGGYATHAAMEISCPVCV